MTAGIHMNPATQGLREVLDVVEKSQLVQDSERLRKEAYTAAVLLDWIRPALENDKIVDSRPEKAMTHDKATHPRAHDDDPHVSYW